MSFNSKAVRLLISGCLLITALAGVVRADAFDDQVQAASEKLEKLLPQSEQLMNAGKFDEANQLLVKLFSEQPTAAESFVLANVLFENDRAQSYALHKAAAAAEPNRPEVMYEWAIEQHRAGEHKAALEAYAVFSRADPNNAVPYGLQADCLLHLGRIDEALAAWKKSERATRGSLESMENMVCAISREPAPYRRRADLLAKTKQGDVAAAMDLIALDCDFPQDWWNRGPQRAYLKNDLASIQTLNLPKDDIRLRAMLCAAGCSLADSDDTAAVKKCLADYQILTDPGLTFPTHGGLLVPILRAATASKVISEADLRQRYGPAILVAARSGHDVDLWNMALFANPAPDQMLALENEAWKATNDARFAAGVVMLESQNKSFNSANPTLQAALKQFPDDGRIQRVAVAVARRDNTLSRAILANAAMAEFHYFTSMVAPATAIDRPRSNLLRAYFKLMEDLPATTAPATAP